MTGRNCNSIVRAAAILLCASQIAHAQEDAGRIEKRFEIVPEPKAALKPLVFPIDERQPPEQASQIKFTLKELRLAGNTAFAADALAPLWADLLNREISLLDIYTLRDAITARYGNAGFGLSKAFVPEQRIQADGIVHLEVLEGFIDEVIVDGAAEVLGEARKFLDHAIAALKMERPANAKTLERYLLLANDRFGIKATSTLKASEKNHGATTLLLKVEKAPAIEGGVSLDNRGTDAVGPHQINANLAINSLMGRPGQATVSYAMVDQGRELQYWTLGYTEVVALEGTALGLTVGNSVSEPGTAALRALNNRSVSDTVSIKLSHPFLRTRQENFTAHAKLERKETESRSLGAISSADTLESLRLGINYDRADAWSGVNQALVEFSAGLGGMSNDYALKSRADGRVDYNKLTVNLSRNQQLGYFSSDLAKWSVNAALMGQHSPTGLLSGEECGVGGQQFGRAYDASEILGDSCLAASLELRYAAATDGTPFKFAQFYGYYDGGSVRNKTPLSATDAIQKSLSSAGFGMRFGLGQYLTGSIEAAQPLTRIVANKGNEKARVFASLSVRF